MTENTAKKVEELNTQTSEALTFDKHDKFQRKPFAQQLTKAITTFSPFYDEAFVLSLNAPFGRGKSTFLKMWQNMLESDEYNMECIYINAWEHDFDDSPIVPILVALLEHLEKKNTTNTEELEKTGKGVMAAVGSIVHDVVETKTGVSISNAIQAYNNEDKSQIEALGGEVYQEFLFKKDVFEQLRIQLGEYAKKLKGPLVIFVDELDRARPSYSIEFLETIKHIFGVKGLCFVLAVDRKQLAQSVAQLYGKVDFENYYLRFVTREANLSEASIVDVSPFVVQLAEKFIDEKKQQKVKFAFDEQQQTHALEFICHLATGFKLEPRQIDKLFRIFTQLMAIESTTDTAEIKAGIATNHARNKRPRKF